MKKPDVIEQVPISMVELKSQLKTIEKRDEELSFRGGRTLDYLNAFVILTKKNSQELEKKLRDLNISKLKDEFIVKIIDTVPKSLEELKILLQGYTLSLSSDELDKVMKVIKGYLPKKK